MKYFITVICNLLLLSAYSQDAASIKKQLKGKWISEDDKKYHVVFNDSMKQDLYAGKLQSSFRYWIKQDSLIAKDLSNGHIYNYSIMGLTETHLTLMYLVRGNLLTFRKQKISNKNPAKKQQKN
jgi:hypothetical protein